MTNNKIPSGTIKHYELLKLKVAKQPNWIFSSLLSLDGLVQSCMAHSQSLLDETAAFYAEQGTTPLFFTTCLMRHLKPHTQELWLHLWCHFIHLHTCTQST